MFTFINIICRIVETVYFITIIYLKYSNYLFLEEFIFQLANFFLFFFIFPNQSLLYYLQKTNQLKVKNEKFKLKQKNQILIYLVN